MFPTLRLTSSLAMLEHIIWAPPNPSREEATRYLAAEGERLMRARGGNLIQTLNYTTSPSYSLRQISLTRVPSPGYQDVYVIPTFKARGLRKDTCKLV